MLKLWQKIKDFFALIGVFFSVALAAWALIRRRNLRNDSGRDESTGGYLDKAISGNSKAQELNEKSRDINTEAQGITSTIERDNISASEHIERAERLNEDARNIIEGIKQRGE